MNILGVSAYFHDSAAALIRDGHVLLAAEEERFTRKKHDSSFPAEVIKWLIGESGLRPQEIQKIIYYEKPFLKFDRLLENTFSYAPFGFSFFRDSFPTWMKDKLFLKQTLKKELARLDLAHCELHFSEHHLSHAASAFYPSPFEEAAVLCLDGVGEWMTTSLWHGKGEKLELLSYQDYPHSLGLFYSAMTALCGFRVNSDEYKVMGLSPYGKPRFVELMRRELIDVKPDGSFRLRMDNFSFARKSEMISVATATRLFGRAPRLETEPIDAFHCDLACSAQVIVNEIVVALASSLREKTGCRKLCLAGGVALNCVANGLLLEKNIVDELWVQPAAGDSGGAIGAALAYDFLERKTKRVISSMDLQRGSLFGTKYSGEQVSTVLENSGVTFDRYQSMEELNVKVAELLASGMIGGLFNGPMEFGPRALGARSIVADPRFKDARDRVNKAIKYRESFRPFAPAILLEHAEKYFDIQQEAPYMQIALKLKEEFRTQEDTLMNTEGFERLKIDHCSIPAVVHVDYSARVQTLNRLRHPQLYNLVEKFHDRTGCPLVLNTSFNIKGEPIVRTPEEALACFQKTELDFLAIENCLIIKERE
jgi:carbamoyltransferase